MSPASAPISGERPRNNHRRAKQPRSLNRLYQVVRHRDVHGRHTGDIESPPLRAVGADSTEQLLR